MENLSLEGLINQYTTNIRNGMFTTIPGRVVNTPNLEEQRVDVQILVNKVTTDNVSRVHTVLLNVPLIFPGSGTSQFSFPVVSGDTVLLVFSQRSIDRFKLGAKEPHTPTDFRKYSRNDAMAIPGLFPFLDAVNNPSKRSLDHSVQDTVVVHNIGTSEECEVRLKATGDIVINAPGNKVEVNCQDSVVNASNSSEVNTQAATINASSKTTINTPNTTITGDVSVNGTLTADVDVVASGISLTGHTHTGDSGGTTSTPN